MLRNALKIFAFIRKSTSTFKALPLFWTTIVIRKLLECIPSKIFPLLGKGLGSLLYLFLPELKKTAQLNLSLIYQNTKTPKEKNILVKKSLQHLAITLLEIVAVQKTVKNIDQKIKIRTQENSESILNQEQLSDLFQMLTNRKGVIFFSGHQANWEIPFLFITGQCEGVAIAKTIKNHKLQNYLTKLRETRKGTIISPNNGIARSIEALSLGKFVGIVGDQALLRSDYSYPFMGYPAWTTTSPALLAYKTQLPVYGISLRRYKDYFELTLTPPIFADKQANIKDEVPRIMDLLLGHLERGIRAAPEQWMWFHKRWKRKLNPKIRKKYHYSFILILLPEKPSNHLKSLTKTLCDLYRGGDLTIALPESETKQDIYEGTDTIIYKNLEFIKTIPNKFQMIFDFIDNANLRKFYRKTGTLKIFTDKQLLQSQLLSPEENLKTKFLKKSFEIKAI